MASDDRRADFSPRRDGLQSVTESESAVGLKSDDPRTEVRPPENPDAHAPWETEAPAQVLKRIKRTAVAAYLVFVPISLYLAGLRGLLALTCASAVTIIAFLWLEEIVELVLQPIPGLHPRRLVVRTLVRFVLLGAALSVTIIVARFNAVSVLMGFSIIVVGICGEALYSLFRTLGQQR